MKLTLPYPPSANRYWRQARGRVYVSKEAKEYKAKVLLLMKRARLKKFEKPKLLRVTLHVFRPQRRGDLDNTQKVLLDSLNKLAYDDDSQIVELHSYRNEDKHSPRVEVEIKEV